MILREWRARASQASAERYPAHFRSSVLPALRQIDGFLDARLYRKPSGEEIEYLVLSRWRSLEAVKAFAGTDYERAVVEPEAAAALLSFDRAVRHYELVAES